MFRKLVLALVVAFSAFSASSAFACPGCATSGVVWSEIKTQRPGATIAILTLAFAIVGAAIICGARFMSRSRLLFAGALLAGAGLGAFFDGILLHQILQWHGMLSSVVAPTDLVSSKVNMFWDGIFHLYSWIATVVAGIIIVRELPKADPEVRARAVSGGAIAGWGLFNLVEGLIDHHVFGLHHVSPGRAELAWDLGFLLSGILLIGFGFARAASVLRSGRGQSSLSSASKE